MLLISEFIAHLCRNQKDAEPSFGGLTFAKQKWPLWGFRQQAEHEVRSLNNINKRFYFAFASPARLAKAKVCDPERSSGNCFRKFLLTLWMNDRAAVTTFRLARQPERSDGSFDNRPSVGNPCSSLNPRRGFRVSKRSDVFAGGHR